MTIIDDGKGIGGVTVVVGELGLVEITDNKGDFVFRGVPAGSYNLSFSLGDNATSSTVEVADGGDHRQRRGYPARGEQRPASQFGNNLLTLEGGTYDVTPSTTTTMSSRTSSPT